jgi:hypothetical protein
MFRLALALFTFSLALAAPAGADSTAPAAPFNGKDLSGWKLKNEKASKWVVGKAEVSAKEPRQLEVAPATGDGAALVNALAVGQHGSDISTEAKYGDVHLELEFMVPKGSNSGVYLMGEYEVQVLDSYGKPDDKLTQGDLGALYSAAAPKKNAAKKPGEWQKFVIDFQAPKFDAAGKKTANAKFVKVVLNGVVLHENVEMKQQTPGGLTGKEHATGPLMFQGDHGPVAFRNIKVTPRK